MKSVIVRNTQSPGDIIVLSAALRDLHRQYPNRFETSLSVSPGAEEAYFNNPNIAGILGHRPAREGRIWYKAEYPLVHKSNQQRKHFLWGFIEHMNKKLKVDVKLSEFKPDLYLTPEEIATPLIEPPYWLFLSGGKTDFQTKIWDQVYWQQVIDGTRDQIRWVQCGGGSSNHIRHIPKQGIYVNMIAKTGLRKLMRLIYHADGVACVVTLAMHLAAAFNKPCVVIAGGREAWWWEAYNEENRLANMQVGYPDWRPPPSDDFVPHRYLHTIGDLPCCKSGGCWKSKVRPRNANGVLPKGSVCQRPVFQNNELIPECKAMIKPDRVIDSIFSYYKDGLIQTHKLIVPTEELSAVVCIYANGSPVVQLDRLQKQLPFDPRVLRGPRHKALTAALKADKDWIVWFEPGNEPEQYWKFGLRRKLGLPAVYGRIHRTADGRFYPYPGFFAVHRSLLKPDAESFVDMFSKVAPDKYRAETDVNISTAPKAVS